MVAVKTVRAIWCIRMNRSARVPGLITNTLNAPQSCIVVVIWNTELGQFDRNNATVSFIRVVVLVM